jgi:uncharacterized protein YbjT (DUF2867 family)
MPQSNKTRWFCRSNALVSALLVAALALLAVVPDRAAAHGPTKSRTVLVFGGSGQLGAEIVRELLGEGHDVFVFLRASSDRSRLRGLPVQLLEGDALVEADVQRALRVTKFDDIVNALGRSESGVEFFATTGRHIVKAAKDAGVARIILHSSVGVGASRAVYPAERWPAMGNLMRAKESAERDLIDSGLRYVIIRNAILRNLAPGQDDLAVLVPGETAYGVVSRAGLGRLTRECIESTECDNRIFHAVDPSMQPPEMPR